MKPGNQQQAIDAVVDWVPRMVEDMTASVSASGGWPGLHEVKGKALLEMYQRADPMKKMELWQRMSPDEQEAMRGLYPGGM